MICNAVTWKAFLPLKDIFRSSKYIHQPYSLFALYTPIYMKNLFYIHIIRIYFKNRQTFQKKKMPFCLHFTVAAELALLTAHASGIQMLKVCFRCKLKWSLFGASQITYSDLCGEKSHWTQGPLQFPAMCSGGPVTLQQQDHSQLLYKTSAAPPSFTRLYIWTEIHNSKTNTTECQEPRQRFPQFSAIPPIKLRQILPNDNCVNFESYLFEKQLQESNCKRVIPRHFCLFFSA